jgi:hypothetical protein
MQTATVLLPTSAGQAAVGLPAAGTPAAPVTFLPTSGNLGNLPAETNSRIAAGSGADEEVVPGPDGVQKFDTVPQKVKPAAQENDPVPEGRPQQPPAPPATPQTPDGTGAARADKACDALFADTTLLGDSATQDWESSPSAQVAVLAVLLGAYWGERSRPAEDRKRLTW